MRSGLGGSRQRSALQLSRLQTPFPFKALAVGIGRLDSKHVCSVRPIIEAEGGIFGNGNRAFHREEKVFSLPDAQAIDKPGRGIEAGPFIHQRDGVVAITELYLYSLNPV